MENKTKMYWIVLSSLATFILTTYFWLASEKGTQPVAEWASAIGTIAAVVVALWPKVEKPNIKVVATQWTISYQRRIGLEYEYEPTRFTDDFAMNITVINSGNAPAYIKSWSVKLEDGNSRNYPVNVVIKGQDILENIAFQDEHLAAAPYISDGQKLIINFVGQPDIVVPVVEKTRISEVTDYE